MKNNIIEGIRLENFRVFKGKSDFELAPITILTGANSSGKSSVIKALKLMQGFWKNLDVKGILDFSEGSHELGDFENILTYDSDKKEIIITYKLKKHILFGNLYIENVFALDESNESNNGKLVRTSLFEGEAVENIKLFEYEISDKIINSTHSEDEEYIYINYERIKNVYVPKIRDIVTAQQRFDEKCPRVKECADNIIDEGIESIIEFENYQGKAVSKKIPITIFYEDSEEHSEQFFWIPVINKELCDFIKIDYEVVRDIIDHEGISFLPEYPKLIERKFFIFAKKYFKNNLDTLVNSYNSKILNLISQIPLEKYADFEEELWNRLQKSYSIKMDKKIFLNLSKMIDKVTKQHISDYVAPFSISEEASAIPNWREYVISNSKTDFMSFFKNIEIKEINNISKYIKKPQDNIINFNNRDIKIPTIESIVFYSILYYSNSLDSEIFEQNTLNIYDCNIINKMPLVEDIKNELECLTYLHTKFVSCNMYFIDAIRANTQRFYTFSSQGTSFNAVLSKYLRQTHTIAEIDFIKKWIKEFEIGNDICIKNISKAGVEIYLVKGEKEINLIDVGYGVTPFLSLLLNIIVAVNEYTSKQNNDDSKKLYDSLGKVPISIAIEEAEIDLHPKLQSILADFFVDAQKTFNINFIVETHSEYLIRKLQFLTAKGEIIPNDTVIHYIEDGGKVRTIHIKINGQLSQPFGNGFTDESSRWVKEMFMYQN